MPNKVSMYPLHCQYLDYSFPGADRGGFTRLGIHCVALQLHSEPKKKHRESYHMEPITLFPCFRGGGGGGWGVGKGYYCYCLPRTEGSDNSWRRQRQIQERG